MVTTVMLCVGIVCVSLVVSGLFVCFASKETRANLVLQFAPSLPPQLARALLVRWYQYVPRDAAEWGDLTYAWYDARCGLSTVMARTPRGPSLCHAESMLELILLLSATEHVHVWTGCEPSPADFAQAGADVAAWSHVD